MSELTRTALPPFKTRLRAYMINHARVLLASLGRLFYSPVSSLMTIAVIGIALALPSSFYVLLKNAQKMSGGWDGVAKISLYIKLDTQPTSINALATELRQLALVESLRIIDREQALQEFRTLSGFGDAMDALQENPLPYVIEITPKVDPQNPLALEQFLARLQTYRAVDSAQLDMQWIKRLYSIMAIVQRGLLIAAAMLSLAVVLIIGNTIRLDIQSRRPEIVVIKLIGGTNGFIRRPFLYSGFWYGLLGGLLSWFLVSSALWLLRGPSQHLAGLYDSAFVLSSLGAFNTLLLISGAILLGYLGSWMAVGRHLREIEPG